MNRELWDSFIEQIDSQVSGDFLSLAKEYEAVEGHPFVVKSYSGNKLLFSMLEQAMLTQNKELLNHTMTFISQLPFDLQRKFQVFGRRHVSPHTSKHKKESASAREIRKKHLVSRLWDMLHLNRTA